MIQIEKIHAILLSGGLIIGEGHTTYLDQDNKFIHETNGKKYVFNDLVSLSIFMAFQNSLVELPKQEHRFVWYVLTIDQVFGYFPRRLDALEYCVRVTSDNRICKGVVRLEAGVYQYIGPRNKKNYLFYIGLRDRLIKNGFEELILEYEKRNNENGKKKLSEF